MKIERKKNILIGLLLLSTIITAILLYLSKFNNFQPQFLPTPVAEANRMRTTFSQPNGMLDKLNRFIIKINYPLDKFIAITDNIKNVSNKDELILRVYFIQLTPEFVGSSGNNFFITNKEKLYVAFLYVDKNSKQIGDPFLLDDKGDIKSIKNENLEKLHLAYQCNIKSQILGFAHDIKNTDYVKVDVKELFEFITKVNNLGNVASKCIDFEMTESIIHDGSNQEGFLTFFNNVSEKNTGAKISELSNYNMNSLCPNQCP
ncbi:hypothetical protein [Chryseobacterium mucoviscidosis]|uniref:hypothetical protein n=1 Tax=Chryseobacterium mucoviscidosis TaxID=1945581 RepID=UPI0030165497